MRILSSVPTLALTTTAAFTVGLNNHAKAADLTLWGKIGNHWEGWASGTYVYSPADNSNGILFAEHTQVSLSSYSTEVGVSTKGSQSISWSIPINEIQTKTLISKPKGSADGVAFLPVILGYLRPSQLSYSVENSVCYLPLFDRQLTAEANAIDISSIETVRGNLLNPVKLTNGRKGTYNEEGSSGSRIGNCRDGTVNAVLSYYDGSETYGMRLIEYFPRIFSFKNPLYPAGLSLKNWLTQRFMEPLI